MLMNSWKTLKLMKKIKEHAKVICEWEDEGVISKFSNEILIVPRYSFISISHHQT